jgi:hypothetical protein
MEKSKSSKLSIIGMWCESPEDNATIICMSSYEILLLLKFDLCIGATSQLEVLVSQYSRHPTQNTDLWTTSSFRSTRHQEQVHVSSVYAVVNFIQQMIILLKRPRKRCPTIHHLTIVFPTKKTRLCLRWIIPHHEPQVIVHCKIAEVQRVAYNWVKISFLG